MAKTTQTRCGSQSHDGESQCVGSKRCAVELVHTQARRVHYGLVVTISVLVQSLQDSTHRRGVSLLFAALLQIPNILWRYRRGIK